MKKYFVLFLLCSLNIFAEDGLIWTKDKFSPLVGNPVCFSIDEKYVFATDGGNLYKLNSQNGEQMDFKKVISTNNIQAMIVINDSIIAVGGSRTYVTLCNVNTGDTFRLLVFPNDGSSSVYSDKLTLSKDKKKLIVRYYDSRFRFALIDLEQNKVISTLRDDNSYFIDYCLNDDFTVMYVLNRVGTDKNHEIKLIKFSLPDLTPVDTFRLNNYNQKTWLSSPIYIPNQNKVAIATDSGKVFIVDVSPNNDLNQYAKYETVEIPKDVDQHITKILLYKNNSIYCDTYGNLVILDILNKKVQFRCKFSYDLGVFNTDQSLLLANGVALFDLNALTGVENNHSNTTNIIYPNPTNNIVNIQNNCELPRLQYTILNQLGQVLSTNIVNNINNQVQINFSQYPASIYYIRLNCNEQVFNYKLIKE
jgi:hypothetical protein